MGNPIRNFDERLIGQKIRMVRLASGIPLTRLAGVLGVSYEQMRKYESGMNRLSASSLAKISQVLMTPISYFVDEPDMVVPADLKVTKTMGELLQLYKSLSPANRKTLLTLARAFSRHR